MNRRTFLGTATVSTAALTRMGSGPARAADGERKLQLGLIGCGGYGRADVKAAFRAGGVEVVGVCDVDSAHLTQSADEFEKLQGTRPRAFKRYGDLLEQSELDAVIIATPPHWHALQFIAACKRGLDIYCEKPLAYDIREGRAMVEAATKSGRVVQIGFQRRKSPAFAAVREYVQAGKAGKIVQVEAQIHYRAGIRDTNVQAPPATLDWDLWCGPSPKLPYRPQIGHHAWRLEKETGHGHLVDWGIHLIDAARWMLGEGMPRTVTAAGGIYTLKDKITTPDILNVAFEFDTCPVAWRHRIWGAAEYTPEARNGVLLYGEKETVFVTDNRWEVIPRAKGGQRRTRTVEADTQKLHMAEFLEAVRTRKQPGCLPEDGYRSTATCKLAMISYDVACKIAWDAKNERIEGNPAAEKLLEREYRSPWHHPYAG